MTGLQDGTRLANRHAGSILLLGLGALAWRNYRAWRRDKPAADRSIALAPPAIETWPSVPKISVLVAAWNEADQITDHIRSFQALSYPHLELILCAGGSDNTYEIARRFGGPRIVILEQQPGEGKQRALRRCLLHASGDVIVLTDADCMLSERAFLQLVRPIVEGRAKVVTGYSEPQPQQRANSLVQYQWFIDRAWSSRVPEITDGVLGRNCALRREILDQIGAFDAPAQTGTDYVLSQLISRAGYQILAVPDSRIATKYPASCRAYLRMWRRWNKNLLIHGVRFGAWRDVRGVAVAAALVCCIVVMPILSLAGGPIALVLSLLLFSTSALNRLRHLAVGARLLGVRVPPRVVAKVPFYTCLDLLAVLLSVRDVVDPRLRSRW